MDEQRVLFLPIDVLSSVTRQIMCARAFQERGFSVSFAGQGEFLEMAATEGFPVYELLSLDPKKFLRKLRSIEKGFSSLLQFARWAWKEIDLERLVQQEVNLFRQVKPRMIISEERVTAVLSARITGLPHASLRNAYRTPYSVFPLLDMSDTVVGRVIPDPSHAQYRLLKAFSRPFLWRMNRVLRAHGVRKPLNFDEYIASDDLVFLCDVPEFSPAGILPSTHHYVGPLFWKNGGNHPDWLKEFSPSESLIYISLGSTGTPELLNVIIRALKGKGHTLVVTFGRSVSDTEKTDWGERVFAERFVDPQRILEKASAVLCHAGNGTIYQALANNVPVVGIPTHLEQRFNAQRLEALGLGREIDLKLLKAAPELLLHALEDFRNDRFMQESIRRFQRRIQSFDAPRRIVELTEAFLRYTS